MNTVPIQQIDDPYSEGLFDLMQHYLAAIGESPLDETAMHRIAGAMADGRIRFFGAKEDGKLIGICSLTTAFTTFGGGSTFGMLEDVFVDEAHRGSGVLRQLVEHVFSLAKREDCASVVVGSSDGDVPMYRAVGFDMKLGTMLARILPRE